MPTRKADRSILRLSIREARYQGFPAFLLLLCKNFPRRRNAVFKTVGSYHINFSFQESAAFTGCNITDCRKYVCMRCRCFFQGMFSHDIVFPGFLQSVVFVNIIIQRQSVSGNGAPHNGSVCGKSRSHRYFCPFQIQQTHTCHPLMKLGYTLMVRCQVETDETLYYLSCSIAK